MSRPEAVTLAPAAESAWEQLRAEIALRTGFWLAFLFGAQSPEVAELVARNRDVARADVLGVEEIAVGPDVDATLSALVAARPGLSATWLVTPPALRDRDAVWAALLARLNERRDVVRRARPGGLVLVCPPGTMPMVRDAAPDLWSFRALTADLRPVVPEAAPDTRGATHPERSTEPQAIEPDTAPSPLLRWITTAVRNRDAETALREARTALEQASTAQDRAVAHGWLARALDLAGEPAEAERHARTALASGSGLGPTMRAALFTLLSRSTDIDGAVAATTELVALRRAELAAAPRSTEARGRLAEALGRHGGRLRAAGDAPSAREVLAESLTLHRDLLRDDDGRLRGVALALGRLGDVERDLGLLESALARHAESVELRRVAARGDGPVAVRDLAVALSTLGNVERDLGRPDDARQHYLESLDLRRSIRAGDDDSGADTAVAGRDLAIVLNQLGGVERDLGRPDDAHRYYAESLDLRRRRRAELGDTPQTVRDLALTLGEIGMVEDDLRRSDVALAHHTESLELTRRLHGSLGDTPQTLRDLLVALGELGDAERGQRRWDAALAHHTEALELTRRLQALVGDTPASQRDLSVTLVHVGDSLRALDRPEDALERYSEASDLDRRVRAAVGDTPRSLRDLAYTLDRVGETELRLGRLDAATAHLDESLALHRSLYASLGDTPQALQDLSGSVINSARVANRSGRPDLARGLVEEAVRLRRRVVYLLGDTPDALEGLVLAILLLAETWAGTAGPVDTLALLDEARDALTRLAELAPDRWDPAIAATIDERIAELDAD